MPTGASTAQRFHSGTVTSRTTTKTRLNVKPTSKETTLGPDKELVSTGTQSDSKAMVQTSSNTDNSISKECEIETQTILKSSDLKNAYDQIQSRFLAMSVVAQEMASNWATSKGATLKIAADFKERERALKEHFDKTFAALVAEHAAELGVCKENYEKVMIFIDFLPLLH